MSSPAASRSNRVLFLAPTARDAQLVGSLLERAAIPSLRCADVHELCSELEEGAGAVMLPEEVVIEGGAQNLVRWLSRQPPWSDLPILVVSRPGADSPAVAQAMDRLGNVTVLERPIRLAALVSAIRTALRARERQYETREYLSQIRRNEAELQFITAVTPLILTRCSRDLRYLFVNRSAAALFGLAPQQMVGRPLAEVMGEEIFATIKPYVERVLEGETVEFEARLPYPAAGLRWVRVNYRPEWGREGKVSGWVASIADITELKTVEEQLKEAHRRKDEFLATLAHELRNPLAPVRNAVQILRMRGPLQPELEWARGVIDRQVAQMTRLIDDLMDVSRIAHNKLELRRERVELARIVNSAVETSRPLIEGGSHPLTVELPPEPVYVHGDATRLAQVFANLLNNAAKFSEPSRPIVITVAREDGEAAVSVRDRGAGIPREMLAQIFDLFTQVARTGGGLGIGLTLVRQLVEMHGGSVRAFSAGAGEGSEFVVRLPVAAAPEEDAPPPNPEVPDTLERRRILVVDDNQDTAESLAAMLGLLGYETRMANDGLAGFEAAAEFRPDLALLDIGMPKLNGYEVAQRIRRQEWGKDVVLVAVTGWGQTEDKQRAAQAGFDHHLVKPVDPAVLTKLLASYSAIGSGK